MDKKRVLNRYILPLLLLLPLSGCYYDSEISRQLDIAENIMENSPDSALLQLSEIKTLDLTQKRDKARHALLLSQALDKNFVDTTEFHVLQPAIDFYYKNGTPDEKLKTYYYQGRIYMNREDNDAAMQCFLNGMELAREISDSLTFARLLVSQGILYYTQYRIADFTENNLRAAKIYKDLDRPALELKSLCNALDGENILHNKAKADSILNLCKALTAKNAEYEDYISSAYVRYANEFGDEDDIRDAIKKMTHTDLTENEKMNLASAYAKIGEPDAALSYLDMIRIEPENIFDSLSYYWVKSFALERKGDHENTIRNLQEYLRLTEVYHDILYSDELLFSEKKHEMELEAIEKIQQKKTLLAWSVCLIVFLLLVALSLYYMNVRNKMQRKIIEQNAESDRQKAASLKKEKEIIELEAENLRHQLHNLENERNSLASSIKERHDMSKQMQDVIRMRLEMLNSMLAKEISADENYARPYRKWIEEIRKDQKKFMNSTRMAFQASHPGFIRHLESHSLTEDEINYVCLYAIGLSGKDIGEYIRLKRHYNVSSDIRRKLGIDGHSTNLGPYVRRLLGIIED